MIFLYERTAKGICILRVLGKDEIVELPEIVEGLPVTELGAYALSDKIDREELYAVLADGKFCRENGEVTSFSGEMPEIEGGTIKEIYLPSNLSKIGRYAFYNCGNLWKISFHSALNDIGAGTFTGCHKIRHLDVHVKSGEISCLRELLSELPEEKCVDYFEENKRGRFWFPEFFEEGIENTPARNLSSIMHGSGVRYRNAFQHKVLNIKEYDELFDHAKVWENEQMVTELALGRLLYPFELSEKAEEQYLNHLRDYLMMTAKLLMKQMKYEAFGKMLEKLKPSKEEIEKILLMAEVNDDARCISICMDYLHRHTKKQRKVFEF